MLSFGRIRGNIGIVSLTFNGGLSCKDDCSASPSERRLRVLSSHRCSSGAANGRNPLPIVIPCHRVIAGDGTIGGYSGGLHVKHRLLALEGIELKL